MSFVSSAASAARIVEGRPRTTRPDAAAPSCQRNHHGSGGERENGAAIIVEHTDRFSRSIEFGENVVRTVLLPKKIPLIIRGLDYTQPENVPFFYASFFILNNLNLKYATLFNPLNK